MDDRRGEQVRIAHCVRMDVAGVVRGLVPDLDVEVERLSSEPVAFTTRITTLGPLFTAHRRTRRARSR